MGFFLSDIFEEKEEDKKFILKEKPRESLQDKLDYIHKVSSPRINKYKERMDKIIKEADFKKWHPGSPEWIAIWKARPDLQEEMLKRRFMWCPDRQQRIVVLKCIKNQKNEECSCDDGKLAFQEMESIKYK